MSCDDPSGDPASVSVAAEPGLGSARSAGTRGTASAAAPDGSTYTAPDLPSSSRRARLRAAGRTEVGGETRERATPPGEQTSSVEAEGHGAGDAGARPVAVAEAAALDLGPSPEETYPLLSEDEAAQFRACCRLLMPGNEGADGPLPAFH